MSTQNPVLPNQVNVVWYERDGRAEVVGVYLDQQEARRKVQALQDERLGEARGTTSYHLQPMPVIGASSVVPDVWGALEGLR